MLASGITPLPAKTDLLVVGGGAAGMVAAWRAASLGCRVTLLEANARLGVKLRISGGGKCNITHAGPVPELLKAFPAGQGRFLRPSLHAFTNDQVLELLRREGVETAARDNGRVFPSGGPGSAHRVTEAFEALARRAGVTVRTEARVAGLEGASPRLAAVVLEGGERLEAQVFILATGGASYPRTGTRGDMLGWLRALGVPVRPWTPALAPIPLLRSRPLWEGVALREGTLVLRAGEGGKVLRTFQGDILFTRNGLTGPAALELSGPAEGARRAGAAWLTYQLGAGDELDAGLQDAQRHNPHLGVRAWLQRWLPERVALTVQEELGLAVDQRLKDLPRAARKALVDRVAAFPLGAPGAVDLDRGEVSAGGVALEAVAPRTMQVKGWENLRVCGELLDVDGPVGGYNLQAAFSTGYAAGTIQGL